MTEDLSDLDRVRGGVAPLLPVSDAVLWREWLDRVRGHVGTVLRIRWHVVRSATEFDLKELYGRGLAPSQAAVVVIEEWGRKLEPQFEAPLC